MSDQPELWEAEASWFHVFRELIRSKKLAKMDGTTVKVYLVIKSMANFHSGQSFPSFETIKEFSGINSKSTVSKALDELAEIGLVTKGKIGKKNTYELREILEVKKSDSGQLAAMASFKYVPEAIGTITQELKKVILKDPNLNSGSVIHIDRINITLVQNAAGANSPVTVHNALVDSSAQSEKVGPKTGP